MRRLALLVVVLIIGLLLGGLVVGGTRLASWFGGGDPETIASASLQSIREQNRLAPFTARYVAVLTSEAKGRFGVSARKTLIVPGTVRYELDLAKLEPRHLRWDKATRTLAVTLPPIELAGPEVDLAAMREYGDGGLRMAISDSRDALDKANRAAAGGALLRQARSPAMMRLAENAARQAIERSFALPLNAAGADARVVARFADELGPPDPSYLDRSRRIEDVLRDRPAAKSPAPAPVPAPAPTPSS